MNFRRSLLFLSLLMTLPVGAFAWPSDNEWQPLLKGGKVLQDANNDAQGSVNVVPDDGSTPATYIYNDGVYFFYRLRLDADPSGTGGQGVLKQFGWGFEIDTDQNPGDYEWLVMIDGISSPEVVSLRENTEKTNIGDPSDKAERLAAEYPLPGNHRILAADTATNGDQDFFLDFRIPYAVFMAETGLTGNSLIRYFAGSSKSTSNLTSNGADLVGGSDLYTGLGDYFSADGDVPSGFGFSDGTVRFVEDIDGFGEMIAAAAGDTLYIRVDDADQTAARNPSRTVPAILTASSGDREQVILSATGVSGKFTGSIASVSGAYTRGDGILQVSPDETITVIYLDAIDSWGNQNQPRTDTLLFTATLTDLSVIKTVDASVASEGDAVSFTVTVTNHGPHDAAGVSVTENLPAGFTFGAPVPSQGTFSGGIWNVGFLARDASATLTLPATVDPGTAGQSLTNTASLTDCIDEDGDGLTDDNDGNDAASVTVYVGGTDLRVTKAVSNEFPAEGDIIDFTVRVLNLGPNSAVNVIVEDVLPGGLTLQPAGAKATSGSYDSGSGLWTIASLPAGGGAKLTLTVGVDTGTADTIITNTAALRNPESHPDTNSSNDSDSAAIKVNFHDLQLTKAVENPSPAPGDDLAPSQGDTVIFTLSLTNLGPNIASGIQVTDLLPPGLSYQSHTAGEAYDPVTGIWTVSDLLASGEIVELAITAAVTASPGQTLVNSAEITAADHLDDNPDNNSDSVTLEVDGTDVMVAKSVDNPIPREGDTIVYTVTTRNNGPVQATGVNITDILPNGVSYTGHSTSQGTYNGKSNGDKVWTVGTLDINATAMLTITATVNSGTSGQTITNVAMITGADQQDPDTANNVGSASISVDGTDLALAKSVNNATPSENQQIAYTLVLSNVGPNDATNITVRDLLPPELEYVSHVGDGAYDPGTGNWNLAGPLAASPDPGNEAGGSASLEITVRVKSGTSGLTITNTAEITALDQGDENSSNDVDSADITVAGIDLALSMEANDPSPPAGGNVVFTVTVTNNGPYEATGVEIEDVLPPGLAYISSTASQGTYSADIWLLGSLADGAAAVLEITAAIDPSAVGKTITNTASLAALNQVDTIAANNSARTDIAPVALPKLTVVKSASGPSAAPGDVITYTVTILNAGSGVAAGVTLHDDMSPYTAWGLDSFGAGQPFQLIQGSPASGLALGTPTYSDDGGSTYSYSPVSGGGSAQAGYDGTITNWRLPMTGEMAAGGSFTLKYKVMVK